MTVAVCQARGMTPALTNWAGNLRFGARQVLEPGSVAEVQEIVATRPRVRALGTRHSFSAVADTDADLVSVAGLPALVEVDTAARQVRVSAGTRYGELAPELDRRGWALANLASLPHISVAGSVATGTHGSGVGHPSLAAQVAALELVTAGGELRLLRRGDPDFPGAVVALGALGVVTALTLDVVPAYALAQTVYEDMPWTDVVDNLDDVLAAAYSVSVFTDWSAPRRGDVWCKARLDEPVPADPWLGAVKARRAHHPVTDDAALTSTPQLGVPGPWFERLPHFRLGFTPSAGAELQSELLVDRAHGAAALASLEPLAADLAAVVHVTEVRSIAADDLWLSPSTGRDSVGIHLTWVPDWAAVAPVLAAVEDRLAPFAPRPHWGKLSSISATDVLATYPHAPDFAALRDRLDPGRTFANRYVEALFGDD